MSGPNAVDLKEMFLSLQEQLLAELRSNQTALRHPGAHGTATEIDWLNMLHNHLPRRYRVAKAKVIDARECSSDEIDIVIYDRQYTPLLFQRHQQRCITAESVYAVLEVRPTFNKRTLRYAADKAESVRRLHRTSGHIPHAGGTYKPRPPFQILSGVLCAKTGWKNAFGQPFEDALFSEAADSARQIDLGCVLDSGAFEFRTTDEGRPAVEVSPAATGLIFFLIHLFSRLQSLATVPAIDFREYEKCLK